MVGGSDGYIYVYSYESYDTMEEVECFKAHDGYHITSLAVKPTHPFMLSTSDDHLIKLWTWEKGWECIQTFLGHYNIVTQVMFDPRDSNRFVSASLDRTVKVSSLRHPAARMEGCNQSISHGPTSKPMFFVVRVLNYSVQCLDCQVWRIDSATCIITLHGHPDGVLCLQHFSCDNQQFLIAGSSDGAAKVITDGISSRTVPSIPVVNTHFLFCFIFFANKIWDLATECPVGMIEGDGNQLNALCFHPELLLLLITGLQDGTVQIWKSSSTTYRYCILLVFK